MQISPILLQEASVRCPSRCSLWRAVNGCCRSLQAVQRHQENLSYWLLNVEQKQCPSVIAPMPFVRRALVTQGRRGCGAMWWWSGGGRKNTIRGRQHLCPLAPRTLHHMLFWAGFYGLHKPGTKFCATLQRSVASSTSNTLAKALKHKSCVQQLLQLSMHLKKYVSSFFQVSEKQFLSTIILQNLVVSTVK